MTSLTMVMSACLVFVSTFTLIAGGSLICPKRKCSVCEFGYKNDENGCPSCNCINPCETVRCRAGTECKLFPVVCKKAPCLPVPTCVPVCPTKAPCLTSKCAYGFETDENGCQTCNCFNPCKNVICEKDKHCEVVQLQCFTTPCPPIIGECVCNTACNKIYKPVCGSDGKTYGNECVLHSSACVNNTGVTVAHAGECKKVYPTVTTKAPCLSTRCPYGYETDANGCQTCRCFNPCKNVTCDKDKHCEVFQLECFTTPCPQRGRCVCNTACSKIYRPVCGSDGKTYGNECVLRSSACVNKTGVIVSHAGACFKNECNTVCTLEFAPVCGSDGKTYGNKCQLLSSACVNNSSVVVAHAGECQKECSTFCTEEFAPVCGSDGKTYGNKCLLLLSTCLNNSGVVVVHAGECHKECSTICTMEYAPVCGSDGKTYGNKCELSSRACVSKSGVIVAHDGECSTTTSMS